MLFERQKRLLALLDALGGDASKLDYQKILFLHCQSEALPPYEFVPYRFGCFSFTSNADLTKLRADGFVLEEEHRWKITDSGRRLTATLPVRQRMLQLSCRCPNRGDRLIAEVYRRFPYYATRSEIAGRILAGDTAALNAIKAARPPCGPPGICTIGYEGRSLEGYLNVLIRAGVTLLCDVRRNPFSRKYGFSRSTLSHACGGVGIQYEHVPELGIESKRRRSLDTQDDYETLFYEYEKHDLPSKLTELERIRGWVKDGNRVALTCFERLPQQCHRHCVAEALEQRFSEIVVAHHL